MSYKIVLTPHASQNIDDAVSYYKENVSKKSAALFAEDYLNTVLEIQQTRYFRIFYESFRGKPMKKFPFIIFYTIDENRKLIIIKAVFHTSQDPVNYPEE